MILGLKNLQGIGRVAEFGRKLVIGVVVELIAWFLFLIRVLVLVLQVRLYERSLRRYSIRIGLRYWGPSLSKLTCVLSTTYIAATPGACKHAIAASAVTVETRGFIRLSHPLSNACLVD